MADFDAGSVEATIVLDRTPWVQGMRQIARDADDLERRRITGRIDADIRPARRQIDLLDGMLTALDRRRTTARVDVDTAGSSAALAGLDSLLDRIDGRRITTTVDLDVLAAQAQATALDTLLGTLDGRRVDVGIDLDTAAASASLAALTTRLDALGANRPTVTVDVDATAAAAQLTQIGAAAQALSGLRPSITVDVDTTWGFLELDTIRMSVVHLDGRHVNITIDVDAGAAIARLSQVEALLAQIAAANPTINIDVDATQATAQIAGLDGALRLLTANDPTINIDLDAGAAIAQLVALRTAAAATGTSSAGAAGGVSSLALAIGALVVVASSLLPALGAIAPALGGIAAIAGASVLAFKGVIGTLSAYKAAQQEATKSSTGSAKSELSNAIAIRGAQQSIADARRNASDSAAAAARQVEGAERTYTSALGAERDAHLAVAQARLDAARQLRDLEAQVKGAALSQEDAALRVREAEAERQRVMALGAKATDLQRDRADLSYREAVQALADQTTRTKDLTDQQKAAAVAGVEGSKVVVDAKAKEAKATLATVDAQRALTQAQENSVRVQERGAEQVARAVQSLADTQAQQAAAAQAQAAQGQTAAQKYTQAMEKLTPAGRGFVEQLIAMKPLLDELGKTAQTAMLPGITAILGRIQAMGPAITTVIGQFGGALGGFAQSFAALMGTERFQAQFKTITDLSVGFTSQVLQSLIPLTDAFGAFGAASGPTVKALADGFSGLLGLGLPQFFQALTPGIGGAGQVISGLFSVVNGLLPILGQLATMLANALGPAMVALAPVFLQVAQAFTSTLQPVLAAAGPLLVELVRAFGRIAVVATPVLVQLGGLFGQLLTALMPLIPPITELAMTFVDALGPIIKQLGPPLIQITGAFVQLASALVGALVPVVSALLAAVGPLIPVFADLAAQVVTLLVSAIIPILPQLTQFAVLMINALGPIVMKMVQALVPVVITLTEAFAELLPALVPIFTQIFVNGLPAITALADIFIALLPAIQDLIPPLVDLLIAVTPIAVMGLQLVGIFFQVASAILSWTAITVIVPLVEGLSAAIVWVLKVLTDLVDGATSAIHAIVDVFQWLYDKLLGHSIIPDIVNGTIGWFNSLWDGTARIFQGIGSAISGTFDWAYDRAVEFGRKLQDSVSATVDGVRSLFSGIQKAFGSPVKFVLETVWNNGLLKAWNFVNDLWGGSDMQPADLSGLSGYATGGPISGPGTGTSDSILARLSHGEFVQPAASVAHYGPAVMEGLRTRAIPREALAAYAGGGPVSRGGVKDGLPAFSWGGIVDAITDPIGKIAGTVKGGWDAAWQWGKDRVHDGIKFVRGKMADGWDATAGKWLGVAGDWAASHLGGIPMQADVVRGVPRHIADGISSFIRGVDAQDKKENGGSAKAAAALQWAMGQAGKPYVWGGTGPNVWDCSGLVQAAYRSVGIALGRTTYDQVTQGRHVDLKDANPGDLVMEQFSGPSPSHVGLYMGPGRLWNAPRPGDVVKESPIMNVVDVRRVAEAGGAGPVSGDLAGWLQAAIVATGVPASWLEPLMTIARYESGGNPRAENHWDSNEALYGGTYGLMQTIRPTFDAYALPGMNDILNPIHNASAAIRYIQKVYTNPWATPGIRSLAFGNPYQGYANGGLPMAGELAMVGERGPELVGFGSMARVLDNLASGNVVAQVAEVLGAMAAMAKATSGASLPQQGAPAAPGPQVIQVRLGGEPVVVRIGEREFDGYLEEKVVEVVLADVEAAGRSR